MVREQERVELTRVLEQTLAKPVRDAAHFAARLKAAGYEGQGSEGKIEFTHKQTGARFPITELRPNGQALGPQLSIAIERTVQQTNSQNQSRGIGL